MQTPSKPWAAAGLAAVAVPGAGYAALILVDAFRCPPSYAVVVEIITGFVALVLAAFGLGVAALAVGFWHGDFPLRSWRIACGVLALGTVIAAAALVLNPTYCLIKYP